MQDAVVDWFDDKKGYGFVKLADGTSTHVHRSVIPGTGYRYLVSGEPISVEVQTDDRSRQSVSVLDFMTEGRLVGTVKEYDNQRGYGLITDCTDGTEHFFHHTNVLRSTGRINLFPGNEVYFSVGTVDARAQALAVKLADPRTPFERFVNLRGSDYAALAQVAEQEDWSSGPGESDSDESSGDFKLLENYLKYTFLRLSDESKIAYGTNSAGEQVAAINTGLVTQNQQEIYGYFRRQHPEALSDYALIDWTRDSDNRLAGVFEPRPQLAKYWSDPKELYFDPTLPIFLDTEHFVEDNLDRYPEMFRNQKPLAVIATSAAKEHAILRAKRNYKTAVPMFHRGETQLLLPLSLDGSGTAQLALVIKRVNDE